MLVRLMQVAYYLHDTLTLLHSARPKLYTVFAFLSAVGLTFKLPEMKIHVAEVVNSIAPDETASSESTPFSCCSLSSQYDIT